MSLEEIVDAALAKLSVWESSRNLDTGITGLTSGGTAENMGAYYAALEAKQTPEQKMAMQIKEKTWNDYEAARKPAIKAMKEAQKSDYPTFGLQNYEEWEMFKAPNLEMALKFVQIRANRIKHADEPVPEGEIKPHTTEMTFY